MSDVDELRRRLDEAQERKNELHQAEQEALQRREEAKAEADRYERQAAQKEEEAEAGKLRPDWNSSQATAVKASATRLKDKAREAREEHQQVKTELEEAEAEQERLAEQLAPKLTARTGEALEELVEAYAALIEAESPLPEVYRDRLLPAQERWGHRRRELDRVLGLANASQRQRREVRDYLKEKIHDAPAAARFGFLIADVLSWSRRGSSPVLEVWQEVGVAEREGSILHHPPIQAPDDTLHRLRAGRLPLDINL